MNFTSCILIFDIGKTNKKYFVLDDSYKIIAESSVQLAETVDEDGFPCEDIFALIQWVEFSYRDVIYRFDKKIKAVNFSTYGASLVHVDGFLQPIAPLYNYLKPFPANLSEALFASYGGENCFSLNTSSPSLGSLNSGLQLFRLKTSHPGLYENITYSLHLPQFISSRFSQEAYSEITSIGCHTGLWDFSKHNYHNWVNETGIVKKLAPIIPGDKSFTKIRKQEIIHAGVGLHDSSAALLTYLHSFSEPFLLVSTGTWCISLNPFNNQPLTDEELNQDCLCYLTVSGKAVKASRLFAGKWHEEQVIKMASHFNLKTAYFSEIKYAHQTLEKALKIEPINSITAETTLHHELSKLNSFDLKLYPTPEMAYHSYMYQLLNCQAASANLVFKNTNIKNIYVDGGFSKNELYMQMLANNYTSKSVYAAAVSQASAFGAALIIHSKWNNKKVPKNLISLHQYKKMNQ